MRDCPTIASRGRNVKQSPYNDPTVGEQNNNHFLCFQAKKMRIRIMVPVNYSFCFFVVMGSFYVGEHGNVVGKI